MVNILLSRWILGELDLAYAITIHKCQGSSLNSMITIVSKNYEFMWFKNLLYISFIKSKEIFP